MPTNGAPHRPKVLVAWDGSPATATAFPIARFSSVEMGRERHAPNPVDW